MGALGWKLLAFGFDIVLNRFKKVVENSPDYLTGAQCGDCKEHQAAQDKVKNDALTGTLDAIKKEMREGFNAMNKQYERDFGILRGVVLAVGMKAGVDAEQLKDLTK